MHIVAIAWMFVVVLMSAAEATSPHGSILGAIFTLLLYGILPLALVLYLIATPARRRAAQRRADNADSGPDPDRGDHPAADPVAPERKVP
jgi:membrane protein implicated in regulation of membrane protease activity